MAGFTTRPVIMGTNGVVAAGHYLAAEAGLRMLGAGGNAIDAGVAAGLALAVLQPHQNGIGGEAPMLVYAADRGRAFAVNGHGVAPGEATIERFREMGIDLVPGDGFLPAVVPAAADAYVTALAVFGTMTLEEVSSPALELAGDGFPMYPDLRGAIEGNLPTWRKRYASSVKVFAPGGRAPGVGEVFAQPDWADAMGLMVEAERRAARRGREAALRAARDVFYRGEIAREIVRFCRATEVLDGSGKAHAGLLSEEDFASYRARVEDTVSVEYRGLTVHKCNTWCQGPVFLQQLTLLEGFDLAAMGHNAPDYIHTVVEAAKLAFADREVYYGDPEFVRVPLKRLLSKAYADRRRRLIGRSASLDDRPGRGAPSRHAPAGAAEREEWPGLHASDTTQLDVVDRFGNMISITPSGGWFSSSPVVPGLGFPLGTRGQMFWLDPEHPNGLEPRKRPRTTLTPSLVTLEGRPWMVFGTPGGDMQDQWTLQFFLNHVDFGMGLQEAIDAPTFHSAHFPSSFYPRQARPGVVTVEGRIPEEVRRELEARGHRVEVTGDWANGMVLAVKFDGDSGVIAGAASPRGTSYALGW
jgi:gamma-glutamyltranspeptidase/glutathione hydrolase